MNVGSMGKKPQKISPNARKKNNDIKKSENGLILRVVAKMARSLVIPPLLCRSLLAEVIAGQLSVEWRLYVLTNPLPADGEG